MDIAAELGMTLATWDTLPDDERSWWVSRWEVKRSECPHCGRDRDDCNNPDVAWHPYRTVCYQTMARAAVERDYEAAHKDRPWHDGTFTKWAKERNPRNPYHYQDGVTIGVAEFPVDPDDDFLSPPELPGIG